MPEARQIDRIVGQFNPDKTAALGQSHLRLGLPIVVRQMQLPFRCIGARFQCLVGRPYGKCEARPEGVGRAHEIAQI